MMYKQNLEHHREMIKNLKRGDKIVTTGGLIGNIIKVNENNTKIIEKVI